MSSGQPESPKAPTVLRAIKQTLCFLTFTIWLRWWWLRRPWLGPNAQAPAATTGLGLHSSALGASVQVRAEPERHQVGQSAAAAPPSGSGDPTELCNTYLMCKKTSLCGLPMHVVAGTLFRPDQQYFLVSFSLQNSSWLFMCQWA